MMKHVAIVLLLALGVFLALVQRGEAATPTVGPGGTYATLQDAVNAAQPGDNITIAAGVYHEEVGIDKPLRLQDFGDGPVVIDGECAREYGVYITGSQVVVRNITVRNTIGASVFIDGNGPNNPAGDTVSGMTLEGFDCQGQGDVWRAGIADWYGKANMVFKDNIIKGKPQSYADGIWVKSNDNDPSGGGHYIAGNVITGGWDGIGGEEEGSAHGTFDKDTIIEGNTITGCWDDGIQSEGGDQNVRIRDNDISGCGTGIAFAAPVSGPLYIENNYIHDLKMGDYGNLYCYKVGNSTSATVYLTGNICDVDSAAEQAQGGADGIHQTNSGMFKIVSRGNVFHVSRYVFEITEPKGTYDEDCLWTSDPGRFIKWQGGVLWGTIEAFRAATGQEMHGVESEDCGSVPTPIPTASPTPTRSPTPTASPTPVVTPTDTPTPPPCRDVRQQYVNGRWRTVHIPLKPEDCVVP